MDESPKALLIYRFPQTTTPLPGTAAACENPFPRQYGRLYRLNVVQKPTPRSEKDVAVVLPPMSGGWHRNPAIRARAAV